MCVLRDGLWIKPNYYFSNDTCITVLLRLILKTPSSVEENLCPRACSQDLSANEAKFSFNPDLPKQRLSPLHECIKKKYCEPSS